jgi:hypothetical protein
MLIDMPPAVIQTFLEEGGMPPVLSQQCVITSTNEGELGCIFRIECLGSVYYLKLHESEGARGSYFLKHLLPLNGQAVREHAEKRRCFVRKMLDSVIEQRSTLVPKPCYFDLQPYPMALQKLRRQTEHVLAELRMDDRYPPRLAGMVGTLWKELAIQHLPTLSPEKSAVWNPLDYSTEHVFRCTAAIGEFQEKSQRYLDQVIQRKIQEDKASAEQIQEELFRKLQHEQRTLFGYELLSQEFFSALGLTDDLADQKTALQHFGKKILEKIKARLSEAKGSSLLELQARFLSTVLVPAKYAQLPFQELLFVAEKERWWTPEKRREGKALDQLQQAETIAQEMLIEPTRILTLVQDVRQFKATYEKLERLPRSIIPQEAHPFNLFVHRADGNTAMLDLDDVSMGVRLADLSTIYVFKILRGLIMQKITKNQASEYLKAVVNGYNSSARDPLTQEELEQMANYSIGVFLNFLPQFGIILRMDPSELDVYNVAMSLDAFVNQFELLKHISQLWESLINV